MKRIDGYWVDENGNRWSDIYSESQAEKYSKTMIDCSGCYDCHDCVHCHNCHDCHDCVKCSYSSYCSYCSNCSNCAHCHGCAYCTECYYFTKNPQRIVSGVMGGRDDQTVVYYDGKNTQVVCGYYRGDLDEFEEKVWETHRENPAYLVQCLEFIRKVREFWGLKKEDER